MMNAAKELRTEFPNTWQNYVLDEFEWPHCVFLYFSQKVFMIFMIFIVSLHSSTATCCYRNPGSRSFQGGDLNLRVRATEWAHWLLRTKHKLEMPSFGRLTGSFVLALVTRTCFFKLTFRSVTVRRESVIIPWEASPLPTQALDLSHSTSNHQLKIISIQVIMRDIVNYTYHGRFQLQGWKQWLI